MRVLTILCSLNIFMSTFSWGKNLQDEKMSNDDTIRYLPVFGRKDKGIDF